MPALILNGNKVQARRKSRRLILQRTESRIDGEKPTELHIERIDRATIVGHPSITTPALQVLMKEGIPVSFISEKGYWYGTLHPDSDRSAVRRIRQYEQYGNPAARLACAKALIQTKISNQRRVLQRLGANRKTARDEEQRSTLAALRQLALQAGSSENLPRLRGLEGMAAAHYFQRLKVFFPENMPFGGRSRRPPRDAANALLSWIYAIVLSEIDAALRIQGLDPCIGWLHELSDGRASLALDLLEPLRAPVCDLFALNLLNHGILQNKHFHHRFDDGGTYLTEEARKIFFTHYEAHMTRKFKIRATCVSPLQNHTTLRQCIDRQVFGVLHLLENHENPRQEFFQMP